jgi:hypothetical protein
MNRIIASVGLVALGAASVQAQSSITGPASKWWNVSATVRGFYDDNINTVQNPGPHDHVWGFQINPRVGISLGNDQTTFSADYAYSFLQYDHKPNGNTEKYDQDHTFNAALSHAFSERYSIRVRDSFVIGQEPDALRQDAAFHTPFRVAGNNIVNSGGITFEAQLTPLFGLEVGYDNAWYDYRDKFSNLSGGKNVNTNGTITSSSLSGALDRIEQTPHISFLWHVMPDTTASLSYQFGQTTYTGDEPIQGTLGDPTHVDPITLLPDPIPADFLTSKVRDVRSHTVYLGLDHQFRRDFYGSVQAGGSYYDYYNLDRTSFGPYARLSLTYVYALESSVQGGFQEGRTATDVVGGGGATAGDIVRDTEASVVFVTLRQRIVPNLFANLNGSFQHSSFNGGGTGFDDKSENFYEFGANLEYRFNAHFSSELGYDYDKLDSEIGQRSYSRNKVYVGATASF